MTKTLSFKTALLALATVGAAFTANSASADEFQGCLEIHWSTFGEAVANNDVDQISAFLQMHGPACAPLHRTAQVLLCEADPSACLQVIEPAAGEPEVDRPQIEIIPEGGRIVDFGQSFSYRGPGEHLGWENDSGNGGSGNDNGGGQSSDSGGSSGGESGGDSGGGTTSDTGPSDKPGNDNPSGSIGISSI